MAESVSRKVREIVDKTPFLRDILRKGFLNYSNFAESILDEVSRDCSKDVKESAIIMALRRYGADLQSDTGEVAVENLKYTIVMHTNIAYLDFVCTPELVQQIGSLYRLAAKNGANDFLNVLTSSDTVTVCAAESLLPAIEEITKNSTLLYRQEDMVALSMVWGSPEIQNPGIVYESARRLAWNSINVLEIFSTVTELSFVIKRTDSFEAYRVLQDLQRSR
ncbi:MAG: hypothetical protein II544_00785 [Spirochaetales bacterium]|jgi:hypothetical protein|nr:hypothetical protein [Spirochaetales bacterium]MBR6347452.1 hypothetical protein [Spirochaetales bacterium]